VFDVPIHAWPAPPAPSRSSRELRRGPRRRFDDLDPPSRATPSHPTEALRPSPRGPTRDPDPPPTLEEAPSRPAHPREHPTHRVTPGPVHSPSPFGEPPARIPPKRSDPRRPVRRAIPLRPPPSKRLLSRVHIPGTPLCTGHSSSGGVSTSPRRGTRAHPAEARGPSRSRPARDPDPPLSLEEAPSRSEHPRNDPPQGPLEVRRRLDLPSACHPRASRRSARTRADPAGGCAGPRRGPRPSSKSSHFRWEPRADRTMMVARWRAVAVCPSWWRWR
jgi:hypothetical protein